MATLQDRTIGAFFLLIAFSVWIYYTIWVFVLPFIDEDHFIQCLFLDREYAILLPTLFITFGLSAVGGFMGWVLLKTKAQKNTRIQNKKTS
ncbi:hypothetical protein HMI54_015300 [Coelomomyces lativittatus]|nr:hypothetical protein HMI56_006182 [Coelomomyces lativittatus]KAJ1513000.1 hypothetical protein HMI54_015300 [Coelomomyces lativittatus]